MGSGKRGGGRGIVGAAPGARTPEPPRRGGDLASRTDAGLSEEAEPVGGRREALHAAQAGVDPGVAYRRYVRSSAWRDCDARREELRLSGRRCRLCDRGAPRVRLEVHHRSYDRLGRERARDLTTLCCECHSVVTDMLRRRRYRDIQLPNLTDTPRVLPARDVGLSVEELT